MSARTDVQNLWRTGQVRYARVPMVRAYKYVRNSDSVSETARPQTQVKALYASVVAQLVIRTKHELFQADDGGHADTVVVNGIVTPSIPAVAVRSSHAL